MQAISEIQVAQNRNQNLELFYSSTDYALAKVRRYNESAGDLTGYDCPKCRNKGNIMILCDSAEAIRECTCMEIRRSLHRLERSGLGDLFTRYTFDSFQASEQWQVQAKELAQLFLSGYHGKWFFVGGQPGSGKTHLCTATMGELMKQGKSARYMLWRDDTVALKASVTDHDSYSKVIQEFKQIDVLYIDDFFKTERGKRPTTADINIAFEVLNYRYNSRHLVTIISSEHTVDSLLDIDEAVGSRIWERSREFCLTIGNDRAKNHRLRQKVSLNDASYKKKIIQIRAR